MKFNQKYNKETIDTPLFKVETNFLQCCSNKICEHNKKQYSQMGLCYKFKRLWSGSCIKRTEN